MLYCLNVGCSDSQNPDGTNLCQSCGTELVLLLRGRYRITQSLGGGGFGKTYLARDRDKLDEQCVVKQFAPQVQGTRALQKATELFGQEAHRLQQLGEHPQIPALYAYFEENKHLYLVQQFIEGWNLLQELDEQGGFSEQKIWELLSDLLPILQAVHEQQVIHRDIKPENIIRRAYDRKLVLIDFGVAKHSSAIATVKQGTIIGSCGYAPMEQMQGGEAYPASDLYSLGATCFHLLTAINPWSLWQVQGYGWIQNWQQYLSHPISEKLELVLSKLLAIHLQQRYQSAAEVLKDLAQYPTPNISPTLVSLPQTSYTASSKGTNSSAIASPPLHPSSIATAMQIPTPAKPTLLRRRSFLPMLGTSLVVIGSAMSLLYFFKGSDSPPVNSLIAPSQSPTNITASPSPKPEKKIEPKISKPATPTATQPLKTLPPQPQPEPSSAPSKSKSLSSDEPQQIYHPSVPSVTKQQAPETVAPQSEPSSAPSKSKFLSSEEPQQIYRPSAPKYSAPQRSSDLTPLWGSSSAPKKSKSASKTPLW